jgi:hypothetical protein
MKAICCTPTDRIAGERNDCTVRAMTYALSLPYAEAHAVLKAAGRKDGRGMVFTSWMDRQSEIARRKVRMIPLVELAPVTVAMRKRVLLEDVYYAGRMKRGRYIIVTTNHALAMIGGYIHDGGKPKRRARVLRVYEVEIREGK